MNSDQAITIALKALEYIVGEDALLRRFMNESGLDADAIRSSVSDPAFLAGVMDFLLNDEALLLVFCEAVAVDPSDPIRARRALPGGAMVEWT